MNAKQAIQIALGHGASIGRHKPGIYYVTFHDGACIREVRVEGKSAKCAVDWIVANLAPAASAEVA